MIAMNGATDIIESTLFSLQNKVPTILIRDSRGATDLLANIIDKYNELSLDDKSLLATEKEIDFVDKFYKQFEKEITKEKYELDTIKNIVNLFHEQIEENNILLISILNFDECDLETAILKALSKGNSKKMINIIKFIKKLTTSFLKVTRVKHNRNQSIQYN